jgi:hypothetical protein
VLAALFTPYPEPAANELTTVGPLAMLYNIQQIERHQYSAGTSQEQNKDYLMFQGLEKVACTSYPAYHAAFSRLSLLEKKMVLVLCNL